MHDPQRRRASKRLLYRAVAELHVKCIGQGFLSTLGPRVLALMYEAIDEASGSVLIVARDGDRVVGFVSGTSSMRNVYRCLLRKWPRLMIAIVPSVLSVARVKRMVETWSHTRGRKPQDGEEVAELLSIAVDPSVQGTGRAELLYLELCARFRSHGVKRFQIVVGSQLARAHGFYAKMGAKPAATVEVHKGVVSVVYVHECPA
jgi:ribosomal protein S18 acetylase RimI-like enzyme